MGGIRIKDAVSFDGYEISSAAFSTNRERAPRWGVATMFVAGQEFESPMLHTEKSHPDGWLFSVQP